MEGVVTMELNDFEKLPVFAPEKVEMWRTALAAWLSYGGALNIRVISLLRYIAASHINKQQRLS